jgi:HEAT repeat protein
MKLSLQPLLVAHPRVQVRSNAALVLGAIKDFRSVEPISTALRNDPAHEVRTWSAEALGLLSERWSAQALEHAVTALIAALQDSDPNVRQKRDFP